MPSPSVEVGLVIGPAEKRSRLMPTALTAVRSLQFGLAAQKSQKTAIIHGFLRERRQEFSAVQTAWRRGRDSNPRFAR